MSRKVDVDVLIHEIVNRPSGVVHLNRPDALTGSAFRQNEIIKIINELAVNEPDTIECGLDEAPCKFKHTCGLWPCMMSDCGEYIPYNEKWEEEDENGEIDV